MDNLEKQIYSVVSGQAKSTIVSHGNIDLNLIPSLAKRITPNIMALLFTKNKKDFQNDILMKKIEDLQAENKSIQHKLSRRQKCIRDLLNKLRNKTLTNL